MRYFEHKWMRMLATLSVVFVVSACGVKSSPGTPEGATYPRTYPPVSASGQNTKTTPRPTTRTVAPGTYQPPPPATQMPR